MPKALVTGGAGFIGSHLVDFLIKKGWEVIVLDNLSHGKKEYLNPKARFFLEDIRDFKKIKKYFKNVDYVFHLAALTRVQCSIENPALYHDHNVNGTFNVLLASKEMGVKRVIFSSSSSVYGQQKKFPLKEDFTPNPISPYGVQKLIGEFYCKMFSNVYGLETVSLRYFNVYGERQPTEGSYALVIGIFLRQRLKNEPMTIFGDGEQRRDFTYVGDVIRANFLAAKSKKVGRGEVINIGNGKNYSVNEIARMIGGPVKYLPPRLEPRITLADNKLAQKLLSFKPTQKLEDWINKYKKKIGLK